MKPVPAWCALSVMLAALMAQPASGGDVRENPDNTVWRGVRAGLFGERPIAEDDGGRIRLVLPARAADASAVPLSVRVAPKAGEPAVRKLYLVIDRNPSPVGGVFEFGPAAGDVEIETRVRVEDYTWVRAIAESADGTLVSARKFIKAAGGCSAPAGKSLQERLAGLGQMKWRIDEPADANAPVPVLLMIRHPNNSGLAMDQATRLYDPPYFIRNVRITHDDELVLSANVDFSLSENPVLRFTVRPGAQRGLRAVAVDTDDRRFESGPPAATPQ